MTLVAANELCVYWRKWPPPHILVAGAIGWKPKRPTSQILPCAKISPSLGPIPSVPPPKAPAPAVDSGAFARLAKAKGGDVTLADLISIA